MPFLGEISGNLADQAHLFLRHGWSVIPLRGNSDLQRPKAPALASWRAYQKRLPRKSEVESWFSFTNDIPDHSSVPVIGKHAIGIGIVLGRVSNLVVLDLDDPVRASAFKRELPHLTQTLVVNSGNRHLPHYYFQVPSDVYIPSRSRAGAELRSDGQYVVAPGSVIGDGTWCVVHDITPKMLTQSDLRALLRFLQAGVLTVGINREKTASDASTGSLNNVSGPVSDSIVIDSNVLIQRYRRLAEHQGRNNALFSVAVLARDCGWSLDRIQTVLVPVHVEQSAVTEHQTETRQQRTGEAVATLQSVYSRPPRGDLGRRKGLPNSVREKLLASDCVNVARLLDAMLLDGICPGQTLTVAGVYERVGKLGIGRNTIYAALKAKTQRGMSIFETVVSPLNPPSLDANAANRFAGSINQCLVDRVANPVKNRGRHAIKYRMPSIEQLCASLEVTDKGSDRLTAEDLRSPSAYRSALHAAFIRRAPGQYSRRWLAERLGVSRDSCRRYERQRHIHVRFAYQTWDVTNENAVGLLPEYPEPGCFLEDERGKRYPPLPVLARMLLAHGRTVVFRIQRSNYYSIAPLLKHFASAHRKTDIRAPWAGKSRRKSSLSDETNAVRKTDAQGTSETHQLQQTVQPANHEAENCCGPQQFPVTARLHKASVMVRRDEPEVVAATVVRVYNQIRALKSERALTRQKAVSLVEQYGCELVSQGLHVLESRRNIYNPAGFLMSWLKSESAYRNTSGDISCVPAQLSKTLRHTTHRLDKKAENCCGPQQFPESDSVMESALSALESQHQKWLDQIEEEVLASQYALSAAYS